MKNLRAPRVSRGDGRRSTTQSAFLLLLALAAAHPLHAGYKAKPWQVRALQSYPSRLTSEGVTIAAEPLFRDDLAAQVFDKGDIVTRGIIPFAVAIFNDNDFPVQVDARSVELICGDERYRTLMPGEVVTRLYQKTGKGVRLPQPIPGISLGGGDASREPLQDFEQKFLTGKIVPPRGSSGGFLYFEISIKALRPYLAASQLYLPDVYREDDGSKLIFFEIEMKPAVEAAAPRSAK